MFKPEILSKADAADIYVAPRTLLTRTAITPETLVRLVKPVTVARGAGDWASLTDALKADSAPQRFASRPETRLGVVLREGASTIGSIFLALSDTAEHGRVFAVVDGRDTAVGAKVALALQPFAAEGSAV